jgi:DnaJ-domain-containing protein 1
MKEIKTKFDGHTPPPWNNFQARLIRKCKGELASRIAEVFPPYRRGTGIVRGDREQHANARLMTAAPDMLAELIKCKQHIEKVSDGYDHPGAFERLSEINKLLGISDDEDNQDEV